MNNHILKYILKPIDSLMTSSIRLKNPGFLSCNRHVASFLMRRGTDYSKNLVKQGIQIRYIYYLLHIPLVFNFKVYFFLSFFVHPAKKCDKKGQLHDNVYFKKSILEEKVGYGVGAVMFRSKYSSIKL